MTLALDDSRWSTLTTAYDGGCDELLGWLRHAYAEGMTEERLGDIINEVQHQGDTSEAMYAVAPHLLALADAAGPKMARQLVIHGGLIHCSSQTSNTIECPEDLRVEFDRSAVIGRQRLMEILPSAQSFDDLKYDFAALAGFMGYGRFGLVVEGIEFFEDQYYQSGFEEPIPGA